MKSDGRQIAQTKTWIGMFFCVTRRLRGVIKLFDIGLAFLFWNFAYLPGWVSHIAEGVIWEMKNVVWDQSEKLTSAIKLTASAMISAVYVSKNHCEKE